MSWAAMVPLERFSLTQKMTVDFRRTVAVGAMVETESRVLEVRNRREAVVEGILTDAAGDVCAVSEGTFRIFPPAVAQRLGIVDDKLRAWFDGLLAITHQS